MAAATTGGILFYFHDLVASYVTTGKAVEVSINAAFVLIGFVATAQSIIISVSNEEFTKRFSSAGGIKEVTRHAMEAILWAVAVLLSGGVILSVESPRNHLAWGAITAFWTSTCVAALLCSYRLLDIQQVILRGVNKLKEDI